MMKKFKKIKVEIENGKVVLTGMNKKTLKKIGSTTNLYYNEDGDMLFITRNNKMMLSNDMSDLEDVTSEESYQSTKTGDSDRMYA
jgi:hypothetical protein